jgi:CUB/sushi domain-containing protein
LVCIGGYDLVGAEIVMCQGNETWSEIPDCKLKDCGPPNNINNINLTGLDKTTFNSTFTVECEDGYDLKGESILQCQINGSWTKYPSCEIKDCGKIGELGNGTIVNQTGTLFGSTAYAICNDGYGLVGKENLTCEANGEWDMLPICIKTECGVYTPPDNAIFGSDYKISCKEGYELIGEATIECLNGNWSGNGTCKRIQCKTLPQIDNADVEPDSGNYFGDTLNVSCKLGFELSNSLKAECDSNKTWINVPTCNPISCGNYSLPPYSEISEISTTTGVFEDTINITCSTGFDIEGENYVICNATGEWENDPVCIPKACGKFETPDHATVPDDTNLDGFTYNQSITVTCDTGYNISGNSVVICGADAKWDSSPLCLPVNCPVLTLDDNTFIDRNETNFVYNDSVKISCDEGYNLTGNAQIFCTAQGNWTEIPSCNKINCRTFVIPANADIGEQSVINHSYNDIINVTCNDGYIITDYTQAICGSDGDWKNIPMCQLVNCSVINIPENAIIEDQMQDGHNYKDIVEIKCKEGYMLNGFNKTECLATGNWSDLPTCIPKQCDFIDSADDGLIFPANNRFFSNENISVSCAVGYELQGNEIVACNINGTWSDFPNCVLNDCEPLDIPVNAANLLNETQFRYKDNVTIECNFGYELSSKDTLSCHPNGTWTDIPSCDPIICTFLDLPENAEAFPNRTDYLFNDNITISCKDGFELEGDTIISCQPNGEWQGIPTCSSVKCNPFDGQNIATIYPDEQNYTYNESVTIECEAGYEIEGESTIQCQSNSSWSNLPTCRPITCDDLILPENATTSSNVTAVKFGDEVFVNCQSKLGINISCYYNGTWPAIDCFSADCSITSVILPKHSKINSTNVPEDTYEIECIEGYKMIGNSSIQCLSGNWSDFPSCEIVECETSDLNSDTYTVDAASNSTIEYNSSVPITCLKGLALTDESDKDLTCGSDGKLYGNPECKIPGKYLRMLYCEE